MQLNTSKIYPDASSQTFMEMSTDSRTHVPNGQAGQLACLANPKA